jgi:hypothetical protein
MKRIQEEMKKGLTSQESNEMSANNTETDTTDTMQTDDLRAYAPASAAMVQKESYESSNVWQEDEDEIDADEHELEDKSSLEAEAESSSAAEIMQNYAEQDFIDETVKKISSMYRKNVDNGKIGIGEYLLDEVFKGNAEEAMSTNPQKNQTFAKIAEKLDQLVEPKTLGSWVRAAAAMRDLKKRVNLPSLTTYHYVELATVRDKEERVRIARQAELESWSVKTLRDEIRKSKGREKSEVENLKADMEKGIRQYIDLSVEDQLKDFVSDIESVKEAYPPDKAMKLLPEVKKCLATVKAQETLFTEFHGSLRSIVEEAMEPLSD